MVEYECIAGSRKSVYNIIKWKKVPYYFNCTLGGEMNTTKPSQNEIDDFVKKDVLDSLGSSDWLEEEKNELERRRLEETDAEPEKDIDPVEELEKHRIKDSKYSVLAYHVGSVSGDQFMQKLSGNFKVSEEGDSLMKSLGVSN